jgi:hypothetical protein
MKRDSSLLLLGVLALALMWWALRPGRVGTPPPRPAPAAGASGAAGHPLPPAQTANPYAGEEPSQLAVFLNAPGRDIASDLRVIDEVFAAYRSATRGGNPIGENREITAALTGRNRLGFAFIPANHPAINASGELCDRWGTPFYFHQLSGTQMEVRSAGPDRKLWTGDDVILTPGPGSPHL